MKEDCLRTENMTVGYGKKPLIREISLQIKPGKILTLIGPNGSGKSTILKSVIKQLKLMGGKVWLGEEDLQRMPSEERARRMAVLMTDRIRPELMTGREVAAYGRYPHTGRMGILSLEDWKKVDEALKLTGAEPFSRQPFSALSDGQRQRVLLARAVCQEPRVMVLDEPTSYLDIRYKLEFLSILKRLAREKEMGVFMSLHELDLAQKISDYVVCVGAGGIECMGRPEEIFTSGYIKALYGIQEGSYDPETGSAEMERIKGEPKVFVIGGNGEGIPLYRRLWREGIPFAAGILHENDREYPVAKALAAQVIDEKAFWPIQEETFSQAAALVKRCGKVICCLSQFGPMNEKNRELIGEGEHVTMSDLFP